MVGRKNGECSLYVQLLEKLKHELRGKRIGEKIATETELMEKYSVSRGTVRHAIDVLVASGNVYKIHGKGTFKGNGIPDVDIHTFIPSFTAEMISSGKIPIVSDILVEDVCIDSKGASYLGVEEGAHVWCLSRFRGEYGEKPFCFSRAYILKEVCPNLKADDLAMSLVSMLKEKFHLKFSNSVNVLTATLIDKEISNITGVPEGHCALKNIFVLRDQFQKPIVYDVSYNWKKDFEFIIRSEIL